MVLRLVHFCMLLLIDLKSTLQQVQSDTEKRSSSSTTVAVSGLHTDETETLSVLEGDSVTLNTGVTVEPDSLILWTYRIKNSETRVATVNNQMISVYDRKENNERFKDRLRVDERTGSLTISNINKSHSGLYKAVITNGAVKHKSFNVAVYGLLMVPVISDSPQKPSVSGGSSSMNCSLVCSVENVSHVTLSWFRGNRSLSSISASDLSISLSLPLEMKCLDDSYSCVVAYSFTNRTTHLNITHHCQKCPGDRHLFVTAMIIVGVLMLLMVIMVVTVFYRYKNKKRGKQEAQTEEEVVTYTDVTFTPGRASHPEPDDQEQTLYSRVALR